MREKFLKAMEKAEDIKVLQNQNQLFQSTGLLGKEREKK